MRYETRHVATEHAVKQVPRRVSLVFVFLGGRYEHERAALDLMVDRPLVFKCPQQGLDRAVRDRLRFVERLGDFTSRCPTATPQDLHDLQLNTPKIGGTHDISSTGRVIYCAKFSRLNYG